MTWTTDFLTRCLDGLPRDKYRARTKAELEDHLLTLVQDLEDAGASPDEAQARALTLMGDPGELNRSFREQWLQWAGNWKHCLATLWKAALHALLVNVLFRWLCIMPLLLAGGSLLFGNRTFVDYLVSDNPVYFILFSIFNFLPGVWFTVRELSDLFALHSKRRVLIVVGVLFAWLLDVGPFLGGVFLFFTVFLLPVIFVGSFPLLFLAWESSSYLLCYIVLSLSFGLLFAVLYRPKSKKTFISADGN